MRPRPTASSTASSSITRRLLPLLAAALLAAGVLPVPAVGAPGTQPASAAASSRPLPSAAPGPSGFRDLEGAVAPKEAVPQSVAPQRILFRFRAERAVRVEIRISRVGNGQNRGRIVRRFVTGPLRPGRWHRRLWNGLDGKGRLVGAGRYRVRVGPAGGRMRTLARPRLRSHTFPVDAPHGTRGYIGTFGAPRSGGRIHEGFDVTANCGSPLVAVRSGTVLKTVYDPVLRGHYVVIKGRAERRSYLYAHLTRAPAVRVGQKVRAGRRLGTVGQTGNAAGTPCHLHIEVRSRGRLLDPAPLLSSWDW